MFILEHELNLLILLCTSFTAYLFPHTFILFPQTTNPLKSWVHPVFLFQHAFHNAERVATLIRVGSRRSTLTTEKRDKCITKMQVAQRSNHTRQKKHLALSLL